MNLCSFSVLCFSFGVLLTAILAIFKRRDPGAVRFFWFSLSVCGWGFLFSLWISQHYAIDTILLLARISHMPKAFISITWVHFIFTFIGKKEPLKFFYKGNYGFALLIAILGQTKWMLSGVQSVMHFPYVPVAGPAHYLLDAHFIILVSYGFYHLIRHCLTERGPSREKLWFLLAGTLIGFLAGTPTLFIYYGISFPGYILGLMPLYPILTGIAMIRYGLFDVQQIAAMFRREKLAAIGTLTASINHEIRNPLFIIQGLANSHTSNCQDGVYKDERTKSENADRALERIAVQSTRAMQIMKRFSAFAKQAVHDRAHFESVNLREAFDNVLALVSYEFELDKIKLQTDLPADLSPIKADRHHVEEILFNLLVNSCQAMKETGGRIEFRANQHNGSVKVSIQDNGPGIPPDKLKQIFEPFYTTKEEGTGLGLYITKQLMEVNQGRINVTSAKGKGTRFDLTFCRI